MGTEAVAVAEAKGRCQTFKNQGENDIKSKKYFFFMYVHSRVLVVVKRSGLEGESRNQKEP